MLSGPLALGNDVPTGASLAETAYLILRHRIVTLEMPPGSPIAEEDIMLELGVSRTPIREAIIRLAKDGLVTVVPRRQTLVSEIRIGHLAHAQAELVSIGKPQQASTLPSSLPTRPATRRRWPLSSQPSAMSTSHSGRLKRRSRICARRWPLRAINSCPTSH